MLISLIHFLLPQDSPIKRLAPFFAAFIFLCSLFAPVHLLAQTPSAMTERELSDEGRRLMDVGDLDGAIEIFQSILSVNPAEPSTHLNLGIIYTRKRQLDDAIASFEEAIAMDPNLIEGHFLLGQVYAATGLREKAERTFKEAITIAPEHPGGHHLLGLLYQSRGLVQKAIASFKKVVSLGGEGRENKQATERLAAFKKEADSRIEAGLEALKNGKRDVAKKLFLEAINFDPDNAIVLFYLGTMSAQKEELDEAVQFFKQALEKEQAYYLVRLHLAETYEKQEDTRKAIEQYQIVLNEVPDKNQEEGVLARGKLDQIGTTPEISKEVRSLLKEGTRLMRLGKLDAAEREFIVALSFLPRQVLAHYKLGKIAFQKQSFPEAEKRFKMVLSIDKKHFLSHLSLGEVYESQGEIALAMDIYTKASQLLPRNQSPHYRMGFLLEKEARYKEALASYKKATALKGDTREKRLAQNRIDFYENRFRINFSNTSIIYDSNVNQSQRPVSEISSETAFGGTYYLKKRDRLQIPIQLDISHLRLHRAQQFFLNGGLTLSLKQIRPSYEFLNGISLSTGLLGGGAIRDRKLFRSHAYTGEIIKRKRIPSEIIFNLNIQKMKNYVNPLFNATRISTRWTLSQNLAVLSPGLGNIRATYSYLVNDVKANDQANRSHGLSLNYGMRLLKKLTGNIGVSTTYSRFRHLDSFSLSNGGQGRRRTNTLSTASLGLSYQVEAGPSFFVRYLLQNNHSNLSSEAPVDLANLSAGQAESLGSYQRSIVTFGARLSRDLRRPYPRWKNLDKRLSVGLTTGYFRPSLKNLNRILANPQRVIIEDPNHLLPSNPDFTSDEKNLRTAEIGGSASIGFEAEWEFSKKHGLVFSASEWQNATVSQDLIPMLLSPTNPAIIVPRFARYNLTINQFFLSWRYSLLNDRKKGRVYFDFGLLGGAISTLTMDALVKVEDNPVGNPFVSLGSSESRGNSFLSRLGIGGSIFIRPWFSVGVNINYLWGSVARLKVKREFPADFRIIPAGLPGLTDNACFRLVDVDIDEEILVEAQCQRDEVKEDTPLKPLKFELDGFAANIAFRFHFGDGVSGKTAFEKWMGLGSDGKKNALLSRWTSRIEKSDIKMDGSLKSETAYRIHEPVSFTKALTLFRLNTRTPLSGKSELTARFRGFYDAIYDLVDIDTISPRRFPNTVLTTLPSVPTPEEVAAVNINNSRDVTIVRQRLEIRELFLDLHYNHLDLRIGRQIVQWGVVTGSRVTNEINPFDFSEFILRDFEDRFIPLMMVKADFYNTDDRLELVWIPEVVPHKPAPSGSEFEQFQILPGFKKPKSFLDSSLSLNLKAFTNSEIAIRYIKSFLGSEISFSAFYAWDDFPSSFRSISGGSSGFGDAPGVIFSPRLKRVTTLGSTFSKNFGKMVFNAEYAYIFGKFFGTRLSVTDPETPDTTQGELQRDYMKYAVGLDFSLFGLPLSVQLLQQFILNWHPTILQDEIDTVAAVFVRKAFLNEGLVIQMLTLYFVNEADFLFRPVLEARLTDNTKLRFGSDLFIGDRGSNVGEFDFIGFFKDSDRLYLELIYSF